MSGYLYSLWKPSHPDRKEDTMLYAIGLFVTDYSIRPDEMARLAEERGFESLWFAEHSHIPVNRRSQYPLGGELDKKYWHSLDPFVALTAAAMVTTRIKLATGIYIVPERDPMTMAKQVASIDMLSGGRFIFGVGAGWNAEELENHGTSFKTRFGVLRERVLAMKEIWTQDEAEFHGRYVNFDKIWSFPKPVQKPHPPVILGGNGPTVIDRIVEYCDGWLPGAAPGIGERISELRRRAREAGRDPESISVTVTTQGMPESRDLVDRLEQSGAQRILFRVESLSKEAMRARLDGLVKLIG
jgi:probable F420-dependent oxidoreductase